MHVEVLILCALVDASHCHLMQALLLIKKNAGGINYVLTAKIKGTIA